ncbi:MAG TPA: PLDc N-terminal domain-containing protein [Solimonas sp.]|nr:PLDc N-terminal domain-containing protein [Solimonas sp.]
MGDYRGIFGILLLIAVIYAVINIAQSNAETGKKALWIVLVLLLPLLGVILWYFLGPKSG